MKLFVFDFAGAWTGGSLVAVAESEEQALALFEEHVQQEDKRGNYSHDKRPSRIIHSYGEVDQTYRHRYELLLVDSFDVANQPARIVTDSYHSG